MAALAEVKIIEKWFRSLDEVFADTKEAPVAYNSEF